MLLHKIAGVRFGADALTAKDKIEQDKLAVSQRIIEPLKITSDSVGLEIGTGMGLLTKHLAKSALAIHGCDISESFVSAAKRECSNIPNCFFNLIESCDLSGFKDEQFNFIYSNNVFIHLDFYEISSYIEQSFRLLKPGGRMYFDFAEAGRVNFSTDVEFLITKQLKKNDPFHKGCVLHNCSTAVYKFAEHVGFKVIASNHLSESYTDMLLEKPS